MGTRPVCVLRPVLVLASEGYAGAAAVGGNPESELESEAGSAVGLAALPDGIA